MANHKKHILLATTGNTPQVLTETLYAIFQSGRPFPEEIYVITTKSSVDVLLNGLFRDGRLQALVDEYQMPMPKFDESHIFLIEDDRGEAVFDAKTAEDQTYMADFITRTVHQLTNDDSTAIHASLAGGRKTMAFYFGYAMSLYGREQDTLSHVFVDNHYELVRDFWYPTKETKWVAGRHGIGEVDLSQASVTLAEIPFVRMRHSLDPTLVKSMTDLSFSQTVAMLNASHRSSLEIEMDCATRTIRVVGIEITLTAKEFAFYLWLVKKGQQGLKVDRYFEDDPSHSQAYLTLYQSLANDPRVFSSFGTTPEDFKEEQCEGLTGMGKEFLQPVCSSVNKKLKKALPSDIASKIGIGSESSSEGQRYGVAHEHTFNIVSHLD